jgi:transposase InsO family protein
MALHPPPPGGEMMIRRSATSRYARRMVVWRVSRTAHARFVLDDMEQAIHVRKPAKGLRARASQRPRCSRRLDQYSGRSTETDPSAGSIGDTYDNTVAETINGPYKVEVIHRRGPWRSFEAVEYAALEWAVRPSPPARPHRQYSARRGRSKLLCRHREARYGCVAQTKLPRGKPHQFNLNGGC